MSGIDVAVSEGESLISSLLKRATECSVVLDGFEVSQMTPPNGSRLSCGAKLEYSQTEFYNTAWQGGIRILGGRAPPASSAC
jgi:hypothetical protein